MEWPGNPRTFPCRAEPLKVARKGWSCGAIWQRDHKCSCLEGTVVNWMELEWRGQGRWEGWGRVPAWACGGHQLMEMLPQICGTSPVRSIE